MKTSGIEKRQDWQAILLTGIMAFLFFRITNKIITKSVA